MNLYIYNFVYQTHSCIIKLIYYTHAKVHSLTSSLPMQTARDFLSEKHLVLRSVTTQIDQNLKGRLATSLYSVLENLYLRVVRNLGFTSTMKPLTSSTMGCRCSSV